MHRRCTHKGLLPVEWREGAAFVLALLTVALGAGGGVKGGGWRGGGELGGRAGGADGGGRGGAYAPPSQTQQASDAFLLAKEALAACAAARAHINSASKVEKLQRELRC